ncbi:hypothetical protein T03_1659, partial [Trichinella britovi]
LLLYSYVQRNVSNIVDWLSLILQWVVSVQWNCFYKLEYLSLIVVQASLNGLKRCTKIYTSLVVRVAISAFGEYFCRVLCE